MSGILWSRRSAPDTTATHIPRPRTTSGGGLAAFTNSVLGLSKAKSRERLRNTGTSSLPAKTSSNRQTVVSTESGSSDMWPEPTTPSSASDTKRSFQGGMGVGIGVGDDPFARPPVYVSKDKPESPVPSLAAFPDPPARRPRPATQRNNSTGPLLFPDPGPSRHLHPPSPKSSTSKLSPKSSSRASSPNRSRSTSASSSVPPRTAPMIPCVSPADMHAHADAVSWNEMFDSDDVARDSRQDNQDGPSIRRGQSAHAVLSPSTRPPVPRLIHSASSSHLSSPTSTPLPSGPLLSPGAHPGRVGYSAVGMGSMTAMASGIVKGLEGGEQRKKLPERPSRSELRPRPSNSSLANPPKRKDSLVALRESSANGLISVFEPDRRPDPGVLEPRSITDAFEPQSPSSIIRVLEALDLSPRSPESTPDASAVSTPNAVSPLRPARPRTASSPSRPQTTRPGTGLRPHPTSPRLGPRLPTSPRLLPTSPRFSEDSLEDLDNYHFTIAPTIQEGDAQSISFSELGVQLGDDEDVWSDDGVTFHHADSLHYVSADSSRYGSASRRPPPSPTSLPFMAGNAHRRRLGNEMVYPSGVHTIPMADQHALARLGKDEDAVVGQSQIDLNASASIEEEQELVSTPPASSPSPVNPLERISSMSTGSQTSSCSSIAPEAVPTTVSSHVAFSRHSRTASYSDSELDFELGSRSGLVAKQAKHPQSTQTAVAWRCGAGNYEKCCGTRATQGGTNTGQYKCCADRTPSGKNARCCAAFVGRPCERPRVSSTSSAELKRQRSLHFSSLPGIPAHAPVPGGKRSKGFFHRPHTSHGKSTSSALLDDETKAIIQSKTREDPGPQSPTSDVFATAPAPSTVASPPTSPASRHEFRAQPIISRAKLNDHLKEALVPISPAPSPDPLKSPKLEPTRARSNTTTTDTSSARSVFSNPSDVPAPMRPLPMRPRRIQNVSLPAMTTSQPVQQPRRYVQSITGAMQPVGLTRPPRSPISGFGLSSLSSGSASSIASGSGMSSIHSSAGFAPIAPGSGLPPPPPRRQAIGRVHTQPIVSFISSHSAPTPHSPLEVNTATLLRHRSSRESYESCRTVRRERSIPLRENQMSFLEFGVEEEEEIEAEEELDQPSQPYPSRPTLQHTQSFLDLSSRQSGDTMRENIAMFS